LGILASSPHFAKVNEQNSFYQATGFWFYQDSDWETWQPEPRIREFMGRSPSPLVLSFSSLALMDAPSVLKIILLIFIKKQITYNIYIVKEARFIDSDTNKKLVCILVC
jgi:hypothetical protein